MPKVITNSTTVLPKSGWASKNTPNTPITIKGLAALNFLPRTSS